MNQADRSRAAMQSVADGARRARRQTREARAGEGSDVHSVHCLRCRGYNAGVDVMNYASMRRLELSIAYLLGVMNGLLLAVFIAWLYH